MPATEEFNPYAAPRALDPQAHTVPILTPDKNHAHGMALHYALPLLKQVIYREAFKNNQMPPVIHYTDYTLPPAQGFEPIHPRGWLTRRPPPAIVAKLLQDAQHPNYASPNDFSRYGTGQLFDFHPDKPHISDKGFEWVSIDLDALKPRELSADEKSALQQVAKDIRVKLNAINELVSEAKDKYGLRAKAIRINSYLECICAAAEGNPLPNDPVRFNEKRDKKVGNEYPVMVYDDLEEDARMLTYHIDNGHLRVESMDTANATVLSSAGRGIVSDLEQHQAVFDLAIQHALYHQAKLGMLQMRRGCLSLGMRS